MQLLTCCFTGPRPKNYPWGNDESRLMLVTQKLEAAVREAVRIGYRHFICGMAAGIDLLASEIVLRLKAEGESISLEAAVPFPEQPARWNKETREQYARILEQCDLVNVIAPSFSLEAYAARDSEMVERSSLVIAVEGQPYGGTARTIAYAKQLRRKIILISGAGSDAPNMVHTKLYHKDRQLREGIMEETQENTRGIGTRIQICNKKNAVTFWGYRNGEAVFCLKTRKGDKNRVTLNGNIVTVNDYKRYPLTPEQLERFQSAKEEFDRDYEAAQRGEKFMRVERGGEVRYIHRDRKNSYTFIEVHADGSVLWRKGSVEEYLRSFDFYIFVDQLHSLGLDREKQKKEEEELLLLTNDDYIVRVVKYLRGEATEEDLKVLERQDRKLRFLPKKEVYDVCDIEFVSFKKQHQCPLHPSLWYDMIVKIDGREYMAVYGWKHETMRILGCPTDIRITPEVFEYIRAWTGGDEFEHFRYPREYRRDAQGNLLYPPKKEDK